MSKELDNLDGDKKPILEFMAASPDQEWCLTQLFKGLENTLPRPNVVKDLLSLVNLKLVSDNFNEKTKRVKYQISPEGLSLCKSEEQQPTVLPG